MPESLTEVLRRVSVLNRDDGRRFTVTDRLDAIAELLRESPYKRVEADALCHLYAQKPLDALPHFLVLVSAHVDVVPEITECFVEDAGGGLLRGTFDNAATDAAAVWLMCAQKLPEHVIFAFTGDEEENGAGAVTTARFLKAQGKKIRVAIVTDVTDRAFDEADFTVENDLWDDLLGKDVIRNEQYA
jgi:acetylornithine deacetylase/succinyl-diaminopimelate desuccinylase-like protein